MVPAKEARRAARRLRAARHRERVAAGLRVVPVEVSGEVISFLVGHGWLNESDALEPARIGDAISRAMRDAARE